MPCANQADYSSCGIFTFLNAAKLMKQIHDDANVKISCVESPLRQYTGKELVLLRKNVKDVLFNRIKIETLVDNLLTDDLGLALDGVIGRKTSLSPSKSTKASSSPSKSKSEK